MFWSYFRTHPTFLELWDYLNGGRPSTNNYETDQSVTEHVISNREAYRQPSCLRNPPTRPSAMDASLAPQSHAILRFQALRSCRQSPTSK
jgi:hypothetical protein